MRQSDKGKKIITALFALAIAVLFFFALFGELSRGKPREKEQDGENYYKDVPSDVFLDGSLKGLADRCLDIYSEYYTAEEYRAVLASPT